MSNTEDGIAFIRRMTRLGTAKPATFQQSRVIAAESDHEVEGSAGAHVAPAVMIVRSHERGRAWTESGGAAGDGDFERPFVDHDHFFVDMAMGRMGRLAGSQLGHVQLDGKSGVRLALQDWPRTVRAARVDGKVLEAVGIRGQWRVLTRGVGRHVDGCQGGGKQKIQISARVVHERQYITAAERAP